MSVNRLRKDYILDRWVVIAEERRRRPKDFVKAEEAKRPSVCAFCPGNEHMTPPAVLVYLESKGETVKDRDQDGFRHRDWLVRCFPNLFPAFTPPVNGFPAEAGGSELLRVMDAVGHHEVLVESPDHDGHPGVSGVRQMVHVLGAYQDRFGALISKEYVRYVSIFRNHGADAGASLSHAHTQIIAAPRVPPTVRKELDESRRFWKEKNSCVFCDIIERESRSPRLIWENERFVAFAPWASVHPYEFWLFPKKHQSTILDMDRAEVRSLAVAFRVCFGGLRRLLGDPSYNFGFHMVPDRSYHWHLEIYPRLTIWAGFEKSTGMFINVVSPEEASTSLGKAIREEEESIS